MVLASTKTENIQTRLPLVSGTDFEGCVGRVAGLADPIQYVKGLVTTHCSAEKLESQARGVAEEEILVGGSRFPKKNLDRRKNVGMPF